MPPVFRTRIDTTPGASSSRHTAIDQRRVLTTFASWSASIITTARASSESFLGLGFSLVSLAIPRSRKPRVTKPFRKIPQGPQQTQLRRLFQHRPWIAFHAGLDKPWRQLCSQTTSPPWLPSARLLKVRMLWKSSTAPTEKTPPVGCVPDIRTKYSKAAAPMWTKNLPNWTTSSRGDYSRSPAQTLKDERNDCCLRVSRLLANEPRESLPFRHGATSITLSISNSGR